MKYEIDSRLVQKGQIFVAIKGYNLDGHDYIEDAINNGASMIISEKELDISIPYQLVDNSEAYLKEQLVLEYADMINEMKLIGVTGTNGKTTTCYLLYQLLEKLGMKAAYIGTIGFMCGDVSRELNNTTPDITNLYSLLLEAREMGAETVIMEVSSHALAFDRVAGLKFQYGAFTNLTEDHLDYHGTMENYLMSKLLFCPKIQHQMIVNIDDEYGKYFKEKSDAITLSMSESDIYIRDFDINPAKTVITFDYQNETYEVMTNLTSKFNVYNYLTAMGLAHLLGFSIIDIIYATKEIYAPMGRCETYQVGDAFAVVDYAHTPDAVLKVITAYREIGKGKIITIIGCGGDRDPKKRPIMGNFASIHSDYVIFTNDNPRTEDPEMIMKDILAGVEKENYEVILDRPLAIKKGLDYLKKDDILLILGKGHEDYQIIGRIKHHLSDKEEVLKYINSNNYQ